MAMQEYEKYAFEKKNDEFLNKSDVEDLLKFREEIRLAHPGQSFEDSVELLRLAREERLKELEQSGNALSSSGGADEFRSANTKG